MTRLPPDCAAISKPHNSAPAGGIEKVLRLLSVVTMLLTVPQVLTIWLGQDGGGVSLVSWAPISSPLGFGSSMASEKR
jgi:hypothetical protein